MSKAFLKRYVKLLPHRAVPHVKSHLGPIGVVLLLTAATVFSFTRLPQKSSPTNLSAEPSRMESLMEPIQPLPDVSAKNIFIIDITTNEVLYQKNADEQIYPASTTKIATALVVLDHFKLDDSITVDKSYPDGQTIGVVAGEKFTVENLLYAMLIYSANDVAEVFAHAYPGGRDAFVASMNDLGPKYGLQHTHFKNPTGLDEEGHYSSAADLARLSVVVMKNPLLKRIVSTESSIITTEDQSQKFVVANTNELLGKVPGILGVKTGFTEKAGESLISEVNREKRNILIAVMGSKDRFGDTQKLIDWAYTR